LGVLNNAAIPFGLRCVATVLILDLLQYGAHRTYHGRHLWRVHEVHHSDVDFDVSLGVRFHPLEILPVQLVHAAAALLLAPPPIAVLGSQLLGVTLDFLTHANARFPWRFERLLRTVFITPDLHRIHHSADQAGHSRNFGQILSVWDRLFGTFAGSQAAGEVRTGVDGVDGGSDIQRLLVRPFRTGK
jgi:sterol desaturase/sphingolipid hydroxylase (fatty acid hydroxylase superfamily)